MLSLLKKAFFLMLLSSAPIATSQAAPITYTIDQTIGSGSVVGTIGTDGKIGAIDSGNIVDWMLTLTSGTASYVLNKSNSKVVTFGSDLTATASALLFNYSGTDDGFLLFQDGLFSGNHYYCNQATEVSTCGQGASVVPQSYLDSSFQNVERSGNLVIGTAVSAVPLPSALPMFGAAILMLVGLTYGAASRRSDGRVEMMV